MKRDERSESRVAVRVGIVLVALAALYCAFAAAGIQLFVLQAKPATNLANPVNNEMKRQTVELV